MFLQEKTPESSLAQSFHSHARGKARQKAGETPTVYKPGEDFSLDTETGPDSNLDLGLPASRPRENLRHPVCGISLQQPE